MIQRWKNWVAIALAALAQPIFWEMATGTGSPALAGTDDAVQSTGTLIVAVRDDSPPFGFRDARGELQGYCVDLAYALADLLSADRIDSLRVRFAISTTQTRWALVRGATVTLECGPNSIYPEREEENGIAFSTPFFTTATQILLPGNVQVEDLQQEGAVVGAIAGTSNESDLLAAFDADRVENEFKTREQGLDAVFDGEIAGFASDGILLLETALARNLTLAEDYQLFTPTLEGRPFCANYGLILPAGETDERWRGIVNNFLAKHRKAKRIHKKWFDNLSPAVTEIADVCSE